MSEEVKCEGCKKVIKTEDMKPHHKIWHYLCWGRMRNREGDTYYEL